MGSLRVMTSETETWQVVSEVQKQCSSRSALFLRFSLQNPGQALAGRRACAVAQSGHLAPHRGHSAGLVPQLLLGSSLCCISPQTSFFFFSQLNNLAALGLSCGTQDLFSLSFFLILKV